MLTAREAKRLGAEGVLVAMKMLAPVKRAGDGNLEIRIKMLIIIAESSSKRLKPLSPPTNLRLSAIAQDLATMASASEGAMRSSRGSQRAGPG